MEQDCVRCGRSTPTCLGVRLHAEGTLELGGLGFHCGRCTAEVMAERRGERFTYLEVAPISMEDARGRLRVFQFQYHTTGPLPGLEATEIESGERCGYRVAVTAGPGESNVSLVGRLLEKTRRELARVHLVEDPGLTLGLAMESSVVRGWIAHDIEHEGPCVYVDGRKLDWRTFGELLLSHEGFQFRLEFHDPTAEVP